MKKIKKMIWIILSLLALLVISILIFINTPKFGRTPRAERLERIKQSPNYRDGKFQNQRETPQLTSEKGYITSIMKLFFKKNKNLRPSKEIPSTNTDLLNLERDKDVLVWFGHSSYFIQIDGKRILVDPVFSNSASPISSYNKSFDGTNQFSIENIPHIDYLIISHDHWDHLDYPTVTGLKPKIGKIICGLGVGEHFEYWGFDKDKIIEMDWNEDISLDTGFNVFCLPARHFSGRGISPNQSLWASFLVQTPTFKIYVGGDSGYDTHFEEIGQRFDGIDLAILENGQYDADWKLIHMMPSEVLQAGRDLKTKRLFPVHNSRYALANHDWDEPLKKITELYDKNDFNLFIPIIGASVNLKDSSYIFSKWWENIEK